MHAHTKQEEIGICWSVCIHSCSNCWLWMANIYQVPRSNHNAQVMQDYRYPGLTWEVNRSYYRYHLLRNWAGHRGNGIRLPVDKLARLVQSLKEWRGKKACRKRELLSIIGLLSHACKVIRPGRSFLCRLIDLSSKVSNLDHFVRSLGTDLWGKSKVL